MWDQVLGVIGKPQVLTELGQRFCKHGTKD